MNINLVERSDQELNPIATETKEKDYETNSGCCMLFVNFTLFLISIALTVVFPIVGLSYLLSISLTMFLVSFFMWFGFLSLELNEAAVITLCGTYKGTVRKSGYFWINPFSSVRRISLRSRNLNGQMIKVNDKIGNPIEIAIVVVWRVKNTARACFDVENYENFVHINSESAVRHIALSYPYDKVGDNDVSLRTGHDQVINQLVSELHERLSKAGIEVEEARITHLAYAPEIANAMLRRQQAEAIISAREKIVQGAVSIVGHALSSLSQNGIVEMNNEEKAKLVSNMLVVLCSESQVHPVVNAS